MKKITERELEILKLLGKGLTKKEVGEELGISMHTVSTHANNAFGKLGVNNLVQALKKI